MSKNDVTRQKIKSKISAIKKINDDPGILVDNLFDKYKDNLSSVDGIVKKSVNDFTSKIKGGGQNKKDIFGEIIDITEGFLGTNKEDPTNQKKTPFVKSKLLKYTKESASITLQSSKEIITDEFKKALFGGTGLCDSNATLGITSIKIDPKAFDFINVLKIDPNTVSGKLMYESDLDLGGIKYNKELYNNFDSGSPYNFNMKDSNKLFDITWDSVNQEYTVGSLTPSMKIGDFINNYYSSIEYPSIPDVVKTAMLMTIQGDGSESISFTKGLEFINRLTQKLFSLCGTPANDNPLLNNTSQQINEDEVDIQSYFDFEDVEGIDLDDEDSRKRRVLRFRDCNDFEVPTNSSHIEDFSYLADKKNLDEVVTNTLNKTATDAYEQAGGSLTLDILQISITGSYILKLPKAIVAAVLSPKIFFPISLIYKILKGTIKSAAELMKLLFNLFFNIIKSLFWKFIREFWKLVKKDLLIFLKTIAIKILANKLKKFKAIILILISILLRILEIGIASCAEIFNLILQTITTALNGALKISIPGLLLVLAERLPGYSADRAYMNAVERMEASGINMGPIYGTENKFPSVVKSIIDGHSEEMDANSFVKIALKPGVIPSGPGGAVVGPLIEGVGKLL